MEKNLKNNFAPLYSLITSVQYYHVVTCWVVKEKLMNLEAAIHEHNEWKIRLVLFMNGSGRFDEKSLGKEGSCALGSWLKQSQNQLGKMPEFQSVVETHTKFHTTAHDVVNLVKSGELHAARQAVAQDGVFSKIAADLDRGLLYLKRRLARAA